MHVVISTADEPGDECNAWGLNTLLLENIYQCTENTVRTSLLWSSGDIQAEIIRCLWQSWEKHVNMICPETRLFIWDSIRRHSTLVEVKSRDYEPDSALFVRSERERSETLICVLMLQFSNIQLKTHHVDGETQGTDASAQYICLVHHGTFTSEAKCNQCIKINAWNKLKHYFV